MNKHVTISENKMVIYIIVVLLNCYFLKEFFDKETHHFCQGKIKFKIIKYSLLNFQYSFAFNNYYNQQKIMIKSLSFMHIIFLYKTSLYPLQLLITRK